MKNMKRKAIKRIGNIIILISLVVYNILVFSTNADAITYKQFIDSIEASVIDSVEFNSESSTAIIHNVDDGNFYSFTVISEENFRKILDDYSMKNSNFTYANSKGKSKFSFWNFILSLSILCLVWNTIYWLVCELKDAVKVDNDNLQYQGFEREKRGLNGSIEKFYATFNDEFRYEPKKLESSSVKFSDVIGLENQIVELEDIVDFLKEPERYRELGGSLPKGVLLSGSTGVGKTLIARAIAGEAGVPFYSVSASELQSKYMGQTEASIRRIFAEALKNAPSIIYIDELDSIAVQRFSDFSNKYAASIVNQLLVCMDGFSENDDVIVIASTNHVEQLDSALLRSGRFDRQIHIHKPDAAARRKLIEHYSRGKKLEDNFPIDKFVEITEGSTGADIKTIMNEAVIITIRNGREYVTEQDFMESYRKRIIGVQNSAKISDKERYKLAIHEAGHAIVSKHFGKEIAEISIIPRGNAGGYNLNVADEKIIRSFSDIEDEIMVLLGGRAAEDIVFGEVFTGSISDLQKATESVEYMFLHYSVNKDKKLSMVLTSDTKLNSVIIDKNYEEMEKYLNDTYKKVTQVICDSKDKLIELAKLVMERDILSRSEIENFFSRCDNSADLNSEEGIAYDAD